MKKHLKAVALALFVAASAMCLTACGDKDNDDSSPEAVVNVQLADTDWAWRDDEGTGIIDMTVEFNGPRLAAVTTTDMSTGIMDVNIYMGTYSVSGNSGTLSLTDDDDDTSFTASFSVSGNTMTLNFRGTTFSLTKR